MLSSTQQKVNRSTPGPRNPVRYLVVTQSYQLSSWTLERIWRTLPQLRRSSTMDMKSNHRKQGERGAGTGGSYRSSRPSFTRGMIRNRGMTTLGHLALSCLRTYFISVRRESVKLMLMIRSTTGCGDNHPVEKRKRRWMVVGE